MKKITFVFTLLAALANFAGAQIKPQTFCNPLNLDYRFALDMPSRREAADPVMVLYKGEYYLFASKSGGYWHSPDMRQWTLVVPEGLPIEEYAPAVMVSNGRLYYAAHRGKGLYTTDDPKKGKWRKHTELDIYPDPAFFQDDDGRIYLYYGASFNGSIFVVELDPKQNFKVVDGPHKLMSANSEDHGWEGSGEDNLGYVRSGVNRVEPWIEGSWMTKHNGIYYLQYSAPGTIWKTYADGVYTSKSPTKDFVYQPYSPFSYKPGGFIGSAGHAATFRDKQGNYWRVVTMVISVAHKFERRLGIFPADFDSDGVFRVNTFLGDYPQYLPGTRRNPVDNNLTGWMLLSYGKNATASSTLDAAHKTQNAFDEEIRTFWSAETGNRGEWLMVDLGKSSLINAVQINFAEQDTKVLGRNESVYQQYLLESSFDGKKWTMLVDKTQNKRDVPHDYVELNSARSARWIRLTNIFTPAGGKFAVRDLRVFGSTNQSKPAEVKSFTVLRDKTDARKALLNWQAVEGANAYIVRFGVGPRKLYNNYQVQNSSSLVMNGLNSNADYYFSIDALGAGGITKGKKIIEAKNR